jgi:hypothetical protein
MPIITIYRGASGEGQELAEAVAQDLGYSCVGREVLVGASRGYGIPEANACCRICGPIGSLSKLRCANWLTTAS